MIDIDTIYQKQLAWESWSLQNHWPVPNRAMNFGDGLFETMLTSNGTIRFLEEHISRLTHGMNILKLNHRLIQVEELAELIKTDFPTGKYRIRWNVFRAGKGKYTSCSDAISQSLEVSAFQQAPSLKKRAGISSEVHLYPSLWANCKTLNALPYILASQERVAKNWDEIVLLDNRGFVSEAGASNIFWEVEGRIFTPSLSCSCINGISRRVILNKFVTSNNPVLEGEFKVGSLLKANSIAVSNVTGISSVQQLGDDIYTSDLQVILSKLVD
jgi:branched-subunit amino acid aminotransferase/4-amino-4-deoxychorismate lyase